MAAQQALMVAAAQVGQKFLNSAAEEFGSRVGQELGDFIFGPSDNQPDDIRNKLDAMSDKLDDLLVYSRNTYLLVQQIPDIIDLAFERENLAEARAEIESAMATLIANPDLRHTVDANFVKDLHMSWNVLVRFEDDVDRLVRLPQYAESVVMITNGAFHNEILADIQSKESLLEEVLTNLVEDEMTPAAEEAARIISSQHVKSGQILDESPWLQWNMEGHRTRTERVCNVVPGVPGPVDGPSPSICRDVQKPNKPWNNAVDRKKARLTELAKRMDEIAGEIVSTALAKETLTGYRKALEARANAPGQSRDDGGVDIGQLP